MSSFFRNRYPAPCIWCGQTVAPGEGTGIKHADGWHVQHLNLHCRTTRVETSTSAKVVLTDGNKGGRNA